MKHLKNWLFICAGFAAGLIIGGLGGAAINQASNPLVAQIGENQQYLIMRFKDYDMETAKSLERLFTALDQIMVAGEKMGLSFEEVEAWNKATRLATVRLIDQVRRDGAPPPLDKRPPLGDKDNKSKAKEDP